MYSEYIYKAEMVSKDQELEGTWCGASGGLLAPIEKCSIELMKKRVGTSSHKSTIQSGLRETSVRTFTIVYCFDVYSGAKINGEGYFFLIAQRFISLSYHVGDVS